MKKFCYVFLLIFCLNGCLVLSTPPQTASNSQLLNSELLNRGKELFDKQCVSCHGESGMGDGVGAYLLYPHPRDFSFGKFRLVSTVNQIPSDDDLLKTISRGMPGSAMPSWEHLPLVDRKALVNYVRYLAKEGRIKRLMDKKKNSSREKAEATVERQSMPGEQIKLPDKIPLTMENIALGRRLFVASCAPCHGMNGEGDGRTDLKDDTGFHIMPRNFTKGVFKGGAQADDIAFRILAGIPATPMPSYADMPGEDLWALVYYVQSLANPTSQALVEQKKMVLVAKKVDDELTTGMDQEIWKKAKPAYLSLLPLWWRRDLIRGVYVQAVHNGNKMAVRLVWEDATENSTVLDQTAFSDGAAVQFSNSIDPPFFAMGYEQDPVNIWNWKAWREPEALKNQVLQDFQQNMPDNLYPSGAPIVENVLYATAKDVGNPVSENYPKTTVEDLNAGGFGTLTNQGPGSQNVTGKGTWKDGFWDVVFIRDLSSEFEGDIVFTPGKSVSVAFALWNGEYQDRNGQKSVSIWQNMIIED